MDGTSLGSFLWQVIILNEFCFLVLISTRFHFMYYHYSGFEMPHFIVLFYHKMLQFITKDKLMNNRKKKGTFRVGRRSPMRSLKMYSYAVKILGRLGETNSRVCRKPFFFIKASTTDQNDAFTSLYIWLMNYAELL